MTMSMTRNLERDLRSLEETLLLIEADSTVDPATKARLTAGVTRTRDRLQEVEYLVPGLYDYSGTNRFLLSVRDQVHLGQKPLSQKQIDAARRALPAAVVEPASLDPRARLDAAYAVIRNSGEVLATARASRIYEVSAQEAIWGAANVLTNRCPDGCCGGSENYATYEEWVEAVEAVADRLVRADA